MVYKNLFDSFTDFMNSSNSNFQLNVQMLYHKLDYDKAILEELFYKFGYPFYWNDGDPKGLGRTGPFEHSGIDPMQYGQFHKAKI